MSLADNKDFAVIRRKVKDCRDQLQTAKHRSSKSSSASISTPPPVADPIGSLLKVDLPSFSGEPTQWRSFITIFQSIMDKHGRHLTDPEKCSLLMKHVKLEDAKRTVLRKSQQEDGFKGADQEFEDTFGSPSIVYCYVVERLLKEEAYNYN